LGFAALSHRSPTLCAVQLLAAGLTGIDAP
jgi:hypothetical protein